MIKLKQDEPRRHALEQEIKGAIKKVKAATNIQKIVRGHKTRKQLPEIIEEYDRQQLINKINNVEQRANRMNNAAIKIQKKIRQNKRKTTPITISNESPISTIQPTNIIANNVSRNVVKNSMNKIVRNQNAATKINSVIKGHLSRKDTRNEILKQASNEKTAATTLQSVIRNRNAKRDMMQQRQLVGEAQLKQMEETQRQMQAAKADKAKKEDIAAKQLQAISKRIKAQSDVSKIKQAKDKIGAATKRLLTERVDSFYGPKTGKSYIINKKTMGQPLVVNKKLKLVSKKKHDAGVFGYETRQDYLDLAEQYKDIMTKGKKK
jgi:hypothetical protein